MPYWLSVWTGIGGVLLLTHDVLTLYDAITPMLEQTHYLPIAVNEMGLALRFIVKGFSPDALVALGKKAIRSAEP